MFFYYYLKSNFKILFLTLIKISILTIIMIFYLLIKIFINQFRDNNVYYVISISL